MSREPRSQPDANDGADDTAARPTPGADMQPEDTGTAESGNTGRGKASEETTKQTGRADEQRDGQG